MALTEKGRHALELAIDKYNEGEWFSAKELSDKCGEKIVAATLTAVCNNGYMEKQAGSPVKYSLIKDAADLLKLEPEQISKGKTKVELENAKKNKNDEFYTQYSDINDELIKYKKYFKNKVILLPCDDHGLNRDNFWKFFVNNFDAFQLKKLIAVHFKDGNNDIDEPAYKIWISDDKNGDGFIDEGDAELEYLQGSGDFRSDEGRALFQEADIIITNPPFSLFREFLAQIMEYQKQFIVLSNQNALTYQETFALLKDNKIWTGYTGNASFVYKTPYINELDANRKFVISKGYNPDDGYVKVPGVCWLTNLPTIKRTEPIIMTESYANPKKEEYPKYDNYDAINVDKVVNIPKDYMGVMGVPITYIYKYNPEQFELIGLMATTKISEYNFGYPYINGQKKYARVLIKRK